MPGASPRVVVVGGSLAGLRAVESLRRHRHDHEIVVLSEERHLPYDRPPLSKQVLAGVLPPEPVALRETDAYEELDVDWRTGRRAVRLDVAARFVELDDGERITFDGLVIAT